MRTRTLAACLAFLATAALARTDAPATPRRPARADLEAQARRCRQILKTSIIDFYLPACVDRTNGGYLEALRGDRFSPTGEKFLTLQARQLWFFSTLAAAGIEKEAALAAARTGFDFLEKKFRDRTHGGYFARVSDAGRPTDRRKHVYLNAFALYGLAAYHRATRDDAALAAARDLFLKLEAKAHDSTHGGYTEFFHEDWRPITDPREPRYIGPPGTRTFNTHLHVLEALTELYRVWPDPRVRRRLAELLVINTLTIRLPEHGCNVDGFTPDWRPIQTAQNLRASYGHDVEGAWLCLDAARALGHPPALLRGWAEGLVGYSLRYGYDRKHGGFFYTGPLGKPADDTKKEWWVQAEALVSMLEMFKLTGRVEYHDAFAQTLDFVEKHQVAAKGSWWATRKADGSPAGTARTSMWQGAYHNGRSMLLCAKLLDELAAPAKKPEDARSAGPALLKVYKNHLVNSQNERVRLRGVNAASLEWTSDGEGHILATVNVAIRDWRANVIRLPLSQDRWFGKAPEQKDEGKAYRRLVKEIVDTCARQGCYVMLDLHWSNAGEWGKNIGQRVMPDRNSLAFWKDLARAYRNHPAVLFDLYNEPHDVSWDVWLKGGKVTERDRRSRRELTFEAVGMQPLLDAVRQTGAKNVVVAGGLDWAYDMSGFLAGKQLADPQGNGVIYANHTYPNKGDTVERWVKKMKAAAKKVPIIVSEFGCEAGGYRGKGGEQWVRQVLQALHEHDWDWIAWDMHPRAGPRLIADWKYTPTPGFGVLVKEALAGKYPGIAPKPE
jgi:mannose/cellobiose epimerase-like protein (N-acyl-D-glucosamine 2-epimerase family)